MKKKHTYNTTIVMDDDYTTKLYIRGSLVHTYDDKKPVRNWFSAMISYMENYRDWNIFIDYQIPSKINKPLRLAWLVLDEPPWLSYEEVNNGLPPFLVPHTKTKWTWEDLKVYCNYQQN